MIIYIYGIISTIINSSPFSKFLSALVSSPSCFLNYLTFSLSSSIPLLILNYKLNFFFINTYHKIFYHTPLFYSNVWWLILCISLRGLRDTQQAGKTLFLGGSARVFTKEISIWIAEPNKVDGPPPCEWAVSNRTQIEQRGRGRVNAMSPLELGPASPVLGHQDSPVLNPLD